MISLPFLCLRAIAGGFLFVVVLAALGVGRAQSAPAGAISPSTGSTIGETSPAPSALPTPLAARPHRVADLTLRTVTLDEERMRDCHVWLDRAAGTYYLVTAAGYRGPQGRPCVVAFTSTDLARWQGPHVIFEVPDDFWSQRGIWAPELHRHGEKFYLFLTFNTDDPFPEQWRNWLPRVKRGSQVLVGDTPLGPFRPFANRSTLPTDMMTLDGTLYVEDGVPWMVFCHEWVQIKDGTVEAVRLTDDLSGTVGEPIRLFHGSEAPWIKKSAEHGNVVTDGPWLHHTQTGKLVMLWSSFGPGGYAVTVAVSTSGKLAGPWRQSREPLFANDGGHPSLFRRLDGQLMLMLHQPNQAGREHARLFEVDDSGDTVLLKNPAPGRLPPGQPVPGFAIDQCVVPLEQSAGRPTAAGWEFWFADRDFADGNTLKLSVVAPGKATHAPHRHVEDEFFYVLTGTAEFYLDGERRTVGPQTSLYAPSWHEHGIRNTGDTELRYLVIKKYPPRPGELVPAAGSP